MKVKEARAGLEVVLDDPRSEFEEFKTNRMLKQGEAAAILMKALSGFEDESPLEPGLEEWVRSVVANSGS